VLDELDGRQQRSRDADAGEPTQLDEFLRW
jgi:hypothetical protein